MIVGTGELDADADGFAPRDQQKEDRVDDVKNAEPLVIDGDYPASGASRAVSRPRDRLRRFERAGIGNVWSAIFLLPLSLKSGKIRDHCIDLVIAELHRRHERSLFEVIGILESSRQIVAAYWSQRPGSDG